MVLDELAAKSAAKPNSIVAAILCRLSRMILLVCTKIKILGMIIMSQKRSHICKVYEGLATEILIYKNECSYLKHLWKYSSEVA